MHWYYLKLLEPVPIHCWIGCSRWKFLRWYWKKFSLVIWSCDLLRSKLLFYLMNIIWKATRTLIHSMRYCHCHSWIHWLWSKWCQGKVRLSCSWIEYIPKLHCQCLIYLLSSELILSVDKCEVEWMWLFSSASIWAFPAHIAFASSIY